MERYHNLSWGTLVYNLVPSNPVGGEEYKYISGPSKLQITPYQEGGQSILGAVTIKNIVSSGTYIVETWLSGQRIETNYINVEQELPTSTHLTEITDWGTEVILSPSLSIGETIRYKEGSLITLDELVQFSDICIRTNGVQYIDGTNELLRVVGITLSPSNITLNIEVISNTINIDNLVSDILLQKSVDLNIGYGTSSDTTSNVTMIDCLVNKTSSTRFTLSYNPSNNNCSNLSETPLSFWYNFLSVPLKIFNLQTWNKSIPLPPDILTSSGNNTSLIFIPHIGVTTKYQFQIEKLDSSGSVVSTYTQIVLVTAPFIDNNDPSFEISLNGGYTINSTVLSCSTLELYNGVQVVYYLNDIEVGRGIIDLNGDNFLTVPSLSTTGELKCRLESGSGISIFSDSKIVTGSRIDLDILDPEVSCENNTLVLNYTINNVGPDVLPTSTRVLLELVDIQFEPIDSDNATIITSTKGSQDFNIDDYNLILNQDILVGESFDLVISVPNQDCSTTKPCLKLKLTLPDSLTTQCVQESNCYYFGLPPSEKPTLNKIRSGDRLITGFGCPLGTVKSLFVKSYDSIEFLEFTINKQIDISGNIVFTIPTEISLEVGDVVTIIQQCPNKEVSPRSSEEVVDVSSLLSTKCISGIKIRGMEGQTYEAQIYNYSQTKVLGRVELVGSKFGISIPFNEPNLREEDLQSGDLIGLRILTDCCPTLESNKLKYNPVSNLKVNYECDINSSEGGLASIRPSWVGGEFPMTITLRNKTTNEVIFLKTINDYTESTLINKIPNGSFRVEIGDCGGCTTYLDFQSNCIKYSATKFSIKSGIFYRQNCSAYCTPRAYTYTKQQIITKYSSNSQEEADRLAQEEADRLAILDVQQNGQLQANTYGICDNCSTPTPPPAPVFVPIPVPLPIGSPVPVPVFNPVPVPIYVPPVPVFIPVPVSGSSCSLPSSISILGNSSPVKQTTETYNLNIVGGTNYVIGWTVQGGTIVGPSNGTTIQVNWGADTSNTSYISCVISCSNNPNSTINDLVGFVLSQPQCIIPTAVQISGNSTPVINTTEVYTVSKTGGSDNNTIVWTVQGGTIVGSNTGSTVTVNWGSNKSTLSSVGVSVGCTGGNDIEMDFLFFNLSDPAPVPIPVPIPVPVYCITDISITYNPNLNEGAQQSSISYTRCDGSIYNGGVYYAGDTFTISDCIREGTITMSGRVVINSSQSCTPYTSSTPTGSLGTL